MYKAKVDLLTCIRIAWTVVGLSLDIKNTYFKVPLFQGIVYKITIILYIQLNNGLFKKETTN